MSTQGICWVKGARQLPSHHNWLQFNIFRATIHRSFSVIIVVPTQTFWVLWLTWNSLAVCIHVHNQYGLHPHFVHTLQVLKVILTCNHFLHIYTWELQNTHRKAISSWPLPVELHARLEKAFGGKSFATEQNATFSTYTERKTESRSSLYTLLTHTTLSSSLMHYGLR